MKKPFYQVIMENAIPFLLILTTAATALDSITRALGFLNYKTGLVLLIIAYGSYTLFIYKLEKGKIKWRTRDGQMVRLKKLGVKSDIFCISIILLLSAYTAHDFAKNSPYFKKQELAVEEEPVFNPDDRNFKLLILPWQQECNYNGQQYDIGFVLKQRLDDLSIKDTIHLHTVYLNNIVISKNFNNDSAYALMRYHNADQILYGNQSLGQCEGNGSDKICYKYLTNPRRSELRDAHAKQDEYKMIDFHGYDDIRNGAGLENSDYVIYWMAAMSEMNKQNYPRAIRMFEKIQGYQDEEAVLFQISNCYSYMKNYAAARTNLEKVLAINPQHEEAYVHITMMLVNEGKIEQAKQRNKKLSPGTSDNLSVLVHLYRINKQLNDTAAYNECFARLKQIIPRNDHRLWGELYQNLGEFALAKEHYEKSFEICSKHARDWAVLGELNLALKDTLSAKPYFINALAIDENYVPALCKMGMLLQKEGDYKKAEKYLEKAIRIYPYDEDALVSLGHNYDKLEKKEKALEYFEKALAIHPNQAFALVGAAVQNMKLKNYPEANKYLDRLLGFFPDDLNLLSKIAHLCADKEHYSQAFVYYKRLLKSAPGHGAILYNLASMSACQNNQADALHYLSKALAAMPTLKETACRDGAFKEMRSMPRFIAITQ